jgi:hypothetical protein
MHVIQATEAVYVQWSQDLGAEYIYRVSVYLLGIEW